ncbi:MAG TPA: HAMP domain-containing histidine kinase [Clostridiales bacterium]|nr:HAMP domain-containing histidine kinase [Clostridiales bacterium]
MNEWSLTLIILGLTALILCCTAMVFQHLRLKKTLLTLKKMLDSAIDGSFTEHSYDESLLSSVESSLNRYLTASIVSARNLTAEKEKIKELLADISHQTKTPLSNILLYAQLLEEQELPKESRSCVAALQGQAEKLNFLIASLVKLSRLETGVFTLHPVPGAIAPILEETARQFMQKATHKEIRLTVDSTGAHAVFDPKWTTEALCNLVDNAIKYTPSGGRIQISVTEYNLFCRIDVKDTGIGILEGEQAKIFTRFYRSQSVSEHEGVGIGLYLTRQILNSQGGYIKVASALGSGSVFSMFLPREA